MQRARPWSLPSSRHWMQAEPLELPPPLPDLPMMTRGARRGFEVLIGRRAFARAGESARSGAAAVTRPAVPVAGVPQVRVSIARTLEEIEAARHLVHRRYAWRGYAFESAAPEWVSHAHPRRAQEITFVAASQMATIGTVTLGLDGPLGLCAEETHGDIVGNVRANGRRVCELTRLAIAERADSRSVLASMFGLAYAAGRSIHDVTDVFIEVNPRHVAYYSRILGFAVAGAERQCERVRAPSVLLHLEVEALAERLKPSTGAPLARPAARPLIQAA